MKLTDIISREDNLKVTDLENMFQVHVDQKGNYVLNLNETIYVNMPKDRLKVYIPDHPQFWALISYELYQTTRLDWLLMKINGVSPINVFRPVLASQPIWYLEVGDVQNILDALNEG